MVTALIVDDELHNVTVLQTLLQKYCPEVQVVAQANSADSAFVEINKHKPQLVFLDIKMPKKSGFDLLRMFPEINFEVIFVSSYNDYAITAFEFHALGYILKPIDYSILQKTVRKATTLILRNNSNNNVSHFIKTLSEKDNFINKVSVHHNDKVVFVNVGEIVFIEAHKDYCELNLDDGTCYSSSKDLKKFEGLLKENISFIRVNKSAIVNTDFIKSCTKGDIFEITVSSGQVFEVSRRKRSEILTVLKAKGLIS